MGAGPAGGNTGPNTGPAGMTGTTVVAGKTYKTYGTKKDAEDANLKNFQQSRKNKVKDAKIIGSLGVLKGPLEYGAGVTSKFFTDKVLTSSKAKKNIGYTRSEFAALSAKEKDKVYSNYMSNRMSGATDAYGNVSAGYSREKVVHTNKDGTKVFKNVIMKSGDGGGDNQTRANVVTEKKVGGQTILTTEGKVAEEKSKSDEYDVRKVKKEGRKRYTLTSSKGVTQVSDDYSLGKKSLLGTV